MLALGIRILLPREKPNSIEVRKDKNRLRRLFQTVFSEYEGEKAKTIWNKPYYSGQTATQEIKNCLAIGCSVTLSALRYYATY